MFWLIVFGVCDSFFLNAAVLQCAIHRRWLLRPWFPRSLDDDALTEQKEANASGLHECSQPTDKCSVDELMRRYMVSVYRYRGDTCMANQIRSVKNRTSSKRAFCTVKPRLFPPTDQNTNCLRVSSTEIPITPFGDGVWRTGVQIKVVKYLHGDQCTNDEALFLFGLIHQYFLVSL